MFLFFSLFLFWEIWTGSVNLKKSKSYTNFTVENHGEGSEVSDIRLVLNTTDMILKNYLNKNCSDILFLVNSTSLEYNDFAQFWRESPCNSDFTTFVVRHSKRFESGETTNIDVYSGLDGSEYEIMWDGNFFVFTNDSCMGDWSYYSPMYDALPKIMDTFTPYQVGTTVGHEHTISVMMSPEAFDQTDSCNTNPPPPPTNETRGTLHTHSASVSSGPPDESYPSCYEVVFCSSESYQVHQGYILILKNFTLEDEQLRRFYEMDGLIPRGTDSGENNGICGSDTHVHMERKVYSDVSVIADIYNCRSTDSGGFLAAHVDHVHPFNISTSDTVSNFPDRVEALMYIVLSDLDGMAQSRLEKLQIFLVDEIPPFGYEEVSDLNDAFLIGGTNFGEKTAKDSDGDHSTWDYTNLLAVDDEPGLRVESSGVTVPTIDHIHDSFIVVGGGDNDMNDYPRVEFKTARIKESTNNFEVTNHGTHENSPPKVKLDEFKAVTNFSATNNHGKDLRTSEIRVGVNTEYLISNNFLNEDCSDIVFLVNSYSLEDSNFAEFWREGTCNSENTVFIIKHTEDFGDGEVISISAFSGHEIPLGEWYETPWDGNFFVFTNDSCMGDWSYYSPMYDALPKIMDTFTPYQVGTTVGHQHTISIVTAPETLDSRLQCDIGAPTNETRGDMHTHSASVQSDPPNESYPSCYEVVFCSSDSYQVHQGYILILKNFTLEDEQLRRFYEMDGLIPRGTDSGENNGICGSDTHVHMERKVYSDVSVIADIDNCRGTDSGGFLAAHVDHVHPFNISTSDALSNNPDRATAYFYVALTNPDGTAQSRLEKDLVFLLDKIPPYGYEQLDDLNDNFLVGGTSFAEISSKDSDGDHSFWNSTDLLGVDDHPGLRVESGTTDTPTFIHTHTEFVVVSGDDVDMNDYPRVEFMAGKIKDSTNDIEVELVGTYEINPNVTTSNVTTNSTINNNTTICNGTHCDNSTVICNGTNCDNSTICNGTNCDNSTIICNGTDCNNSTDSDPDPDPDNTDETPPEQTPDDTFFTLQNIFILAGSSVGGFVFCCCCLLMYCVTIMGLSSLFLGGGGVCGVGGLLCCSGSGCIFNTAGRHTGKGLNGTDRTSLLRDGTKGEETPMLDTHIGLENFLINPKDIELKKLLGSGGSDSQVFLARYDLKNVAYKKYRTAIVDDGEIDVDEFRKECNALVRLKHHFVNQWEGVVIDLKSEKKELGIVLELCEKGDLQNYLYKNPETSIEERIRWLYQVAVAMKYLHGKKVVHRDLKPQNVCINENDDAIVVDFGLSKEWYPGDAHTKKIGTSFFCAPEVKKVGKYTTAVDVYSFAFTVFTVLVGKFEDIHGEGVVFHYHDYKFDTIRPDPELLLKVLGEKYAWIYLEIVHKCWDFEPEIRLTFEEICELFKRYGVEDIKKERNVNKNKRKRQESVTQVVEGEEEEEVEGEGENKEGELGLFEDEGEVEEGGMNDDAEIEEEEGEDDYHDEEDEAEIKLEEVNEMI